MGSCCYLYKDVPCKGEGEWTVWNGKEPFYDNFWLSCTEHVGEMLEDAQNQVWPTEWDEGD